MYDYTLEELLELSDSYCLVGQGLHDKDLDTIGQSLYAEAFKIVESIGGHVVFGSGLWSCRFDDEGSDGGPTYLTEIVENYREHFGDPWATPENTRELHKQISKQFGYPIASEIIYRRSESLPPKIDHLIDHVPTGSFYQG